MRMMHDMKVVLSTHCHAMHQFTLPVQSDKMASSGLDTDDYIAIALALDKKKRKKRSKWSKCWLLKRNEISHTNLLEELRLEPQDYFNYMSVLKFVQNASNIIMRHSNLIYNIIYYKAYKY